MRNAALLLGLAGVACAGSAPATRTPAVQTIPSASAEPVAIAPEAPLGPNPSYAPSALTDLAHSVTSLASAVIDGHPPPQGPIPIERFSPDQKLVRASSPLPPSSDLEFLAFGVEMTVVLVAAEETDGASRPAEDAGSLDVTVMLGKTGLKLVELEVRSARKPQAIPPWLSGATAAATSVVDAAKADRLKDLLFGESERAVLQNDRMFARAMKFLPNDEELRRVVAAVRAHPRPVGLRVRSLYLLSRTRRGETWAFQFNVDDDDHGLALESSPLLRADKPDFERESHDEPEVPPP